MDEITQAIREQYEDFPYPAGPPMLRVATDARLLLSLGEKCREQAAPIRVLDAGCGRGVGLLACATLQPDVEFVGIDINRVGIQEIETQIATRGLTNVRVQEVNLMTLEGLEVPEGGFDVIYSSGVLHHLSDPVEGLNRLRSVLAPHGVISLMVYALYGRQPLYRLIRATELLVPENQSLRERITPTRALAKFCDNSILQETPWDFVADTNDTEFVDLCLNPNETSYSVESMWSLLASTQMKFLRWSLPSQWSANIFPEGELRDSANKLDDYNLYQLIEQVSWQKSLELVIGHDHNAPRPAFMGKDLETTALAVSPEITFSVESRNQRTGKRMESITYRRSADDNPVVCTDVAQVQGLSILCEQFQPFTADSFIKIMADDGIAEEHSLAALNYFLEQDVLYRPHLSDL